MANKSVLTREVFLDFYNSHIKPFLGYSFTNIANQFDKANLYSTDEKIVGQWIDGKPLYQKTVYCASVGKNGTERFGTGIANIDKVVEIGGMYKFANDTYPLGTVALGEKFTHTGSVSEYSSDLSCKTIISASNTEIELRNASSNTFESDVYITLKYTKTTDTAIAIGSDTDYSTTEKIIGTWIDGKPLYQKTVAITIPTVTTEGVVASSTFSFASNLDTVINIEAFYAHATAPKVFNILNRQHRGEGEGVVIFVNTSGLLEVESTVVGPSGRVGYATVRYTKTTDIASN